MNSKMDLNTHSEAAAHSGTRNYTHSDTRDCSERVKSLVKCERERMMERVSMRKTDLDSEQ